MEVEAKALETRYIWNDEVEAKSWIQLETGVSVDSG